MIRSPILNVGCAKCQMDKYVDENIGFRQGLCKSWIRLCNSFEQDWAKKKNNVDNIKIMLWMCE